MKILSRLILCITLTAMSLVAAAGPLKFLGIKPEIKITYTGVSGDLLKNITARVDSLKNSLPKPYTSEEMRKFHALVLREIPKALEPYGYFKATIVASKMEPVGNSWHGFYSIDTGPPVYITQMNISVSGEAATDPDFQAYMAKLPLKEGDILDTSKYKKIKQGLFDLAANKGYLAATVTQATINVDLEKNSATIDLAFNSGPRYFFGYITFANTSLSPDFLKKFLVAKTGEPYSGEQLHQSQENLNNSNLFANVIFATDLEKAQNLEVPVIFQTTPRKKQQYNFGLGYGTDTGLRASIGMDLYNLTATGHRFNGSFRMSFPQYVSNIPFKRTNNGYEGDLEAHYIIPGKNPMTDQYDISAGTSYNDQSYGTSRVVKAGPGYTTVIGGWQQVLRLNIHAEDWDFTNVSSPDNTSGQQILLLPIATWTKRSANDTIRPTDGYRINFMVQGTDQFFFPDGLAFLQAKLEAKLIQPIVPRNTLLVMRAAVGSTAVKNPDRLPLSFWFATGGADNVRGYDYDSIGPGTEMAQASIELRQRVYKDFYLAGFIDAGNAGDDIFSSKDQPFLNSIFANRTPGLAAVWLSPIGAMELSFSRFDFSSWQGVANTNIQFSMGVEL